jgi:predicted transposase YdaD
MKTDKELYKLFENDPKLLEELIGIQSEESFDFRSEELKELSVRVDGFFSAAKEDWAYLLEFQGWDDPDIYYRGEIGRILLSKRYRDKKIALVVVFFEAGLDPRTEPWYAYIKAGSPYFRSYYLPQRLKELEEADPDHPLTLVFKPLYENQHSLIKTAPVYYEKLKNSPIETKRKDNLLDIFERLVIQKIINLPREEVLKMLGSLTPLEDTWLYQEIRAKAIIEGKKEGIKEGIKEGKIEGIRGQISQARSFFEQGFLSKEKYEEVVRPLELELAEGESRLKDSAAVED